jgi:hypothetical protein
LFAIFFDPNLKFFVSFVILKNWPKIGKFPKMRVTWSIIQIMRFFFQHLGLSRVHALPLAAGINVDGHSTWHYFSSSSSEVLTFLPEGVVVGIQIFAWAPN